MKIYYKLYQLIKILYKIVKNMPREYKYSLGQAILDLAWKCLDLCVEINNLPDSRKKEKTGKLCADFDKLKIRLKMAQEIYLISVPQYAALEENYILDLGRMIGGWNTWAENED